MSIKKTRASKSELNRMAEIWAIIQRLPEADQIAIYYYMKGRFDAGIADIEIPNVKHNAAS
ncbi:MAG: hypothetical protein FWE42_00950 [Defluviitaleaceae bacterium]|nr:hypothetical protein [Defluviitaleaceae bacterium]